MNDLNSASLVEALKEGALPPSQPWEVSQAVQSIVDDLDSGVGISFSEIRKATSVLNGNRFFVDARRIGASWAGRHAFDPVIFKNHAQALINTGALAAAEELLLENLPRLRMPGASATAQNEIAEYEGLLGRVYKQRFVDTRNVDWLIKAREQYERIYTSNSARYWHGINSVALRAREERELVGTTDLTDAANIYSLVKRLYERNPSDQWLPATASEACLALGDCEGAELWLYRFLHHPRVRPFDIESYDRQLREIWQGSAWTGGDSCSDRLSRIVTRFLAQTTHSISISPSEVQSVRAAIQGMTDGLEKNFLGESTLTLDSVRRLLQACESVGCVITSFGERKGTGFLLNAPRTHNWGGGLVFVTNAHVIGDPIFGGIRWQEARVTFEVESREAGRQVDYQVGEPIFTSGPGPLGVCSGKECGLDVAIVPLNGIAPTVPALSTAQGLPDLDGKSRVFVVGHPRGSGLQISLQDSRLLDVDDHEHLVHYRTPTDGGNSGSPVFNQDWKVVALHHAGSFNTPRLHGNGRYEANEGISIQYILSTWLGGR